MCAVCKATPKMSVPSVPGLALPDPGAPRLLPAACCYCDPAAGQHCHLAILEVCRVPGPHQALQTPMNDTLIPCPPVFKEGGAKRMGRHSLAACSMPSPLPTPGQPASCEKRFVHRFSPTSKPGGYPGGGERLSGWQSWGEGGETSLQMLDLIGNFWAL